MFSIAYGRAAGSAGPLERKTPAGLSARTSSAGVFAGTTRTRANDASDRRMLRFTPKS